MSLHLCGMTEEITVLNYCCFKVLILVLITYSSFVARYETAVDDCLCEKMKLMLRSENLKGMTRGQHGDYTKLFRFPKGDRCEYLRKR